MSDTGPPPYSWTDCARDLAMRTELTIQDATALVWDIRSLLEPEVAVNLLVDLFRSANGPSRRGAALAALLQKVRS